jgi:phosphoglycolate phosphatase
VKKLIIFDLDGTLIDTVADLAMSTNYALGQLGFPQHATEAYRFFVGNGINKLFERTLPDGFKDTANVLAVRQLFLKHYELHCADASRPYCGIPELLDACVSDGFQLAVASNKYQAATVRLVEKFFPGVPFRIVLGQRDGIPAKPDSYIVNEILASCGIAAGDALFVGDSGVDMQTAINSGVEACGVTWGFRPRAELTALNPAHIVDRPEEIMEILSR